MINKITAQKIQNLFSLPLNELILKAQKVHNENFDKDDVQLASLISIKTGSCPEDCKYCPQSAHYNVNLKKENLINISEVKKAARIAKNNGARTCNITPHEILVGILFATHFFVQVRSPGRQRNPC